VDSYPRTGNKNGVNCIAYSYFLFVLLLVLRYHQLRLYDEQDWCIDTP